jgi:hypothetical protein
MAYELLEAWEPLQAGVTLSGFAGYGWTFDGSSQIITGEQRSGTRALRLTTTQGAFYPLALGNIKVAGFAVKYTTANASGTRANPIALFVFSVGNPIWLRFTEGGTLQIMDDTTPIATGTTVINIGSYAYIEMVINNNTGEIDVYLNNPGGGVPTPEVSATFTPRAGQVSIFRFGWLNTISSGSASTRYYDDIYVDDAGLLYGDSAVLYDFPASDGVAQDWTPSSVPAWERINNVPVDAAQYIEATTASDVSTFGFDGYSETIFQLYGVGLIANWLRTGATAETARIGPNISGTDYFDAAVTVPQTTAEWARSYWEQNPATSSPWAPADVQTGFSASLERVT